MVLGIYGKPDPETQKYSDTATLKLAAVTPRALKDDVEGALLVFRFTLALSKVSSLNFTVTSSFQFQL